MTQDGQVRGSVAAGTSPDVDGFPRRHVGRRLPRLEDRPFVTGTARYVDDLAVPGVLHAAIVRSPVAHATVGAVRPGDLIGRAGDGVVLVAGHAEVAGWAAGPLRNVWILPGQWQHARWICDGRVRFVGDPLAIVVAESAALAADAAEATEVELEQLPSVAGIDAALRGDVVIEPGRSDNVMAAWAAGDDDAHCDAVLGRCDRTIRFSASIGRVAGTPIEPRAVVVDPGRPGRDGRPEKLTVWTSTQAPHAVRDALTVATGLPHHRIRVVAPDVGGGFGLKDHAYDDEVMVVLAAIRLGRPVKWVESRHESLTVTTQARDERYDVEIGADADGTLRALRVRVVRDCGAHFSIFGAGPLFALCGTLAGPYRWDAVTTHATAVQTTTCPTHSYRGFGQTQATFVRELAVDRIATELGLDRFELRARNCVRPDQQPWLPRTTPMRYDGGDYAESVRRAERMASAWGDPPDDGRLWGTGVATYVHMAGVGPSQGNPSIGLQVGSWESTELRMEPDATVRAHVGVSSHGQGHATTFAQLIADRLGIEPEQVEIVHSDTDSTPYSAYGTAASRSIAVGGGAAVLAAERLAAQITAIAAEMLEAAPADIVLADGVASVAGSPDRSVPLAEVATRAWQGWGLPAGAEPGLHTRAAYDPANFTWSYGTHVCRAAVDPETGAIEIDRYAAVLDCGTIVNPTIVEGQLHGGIAQGLGPAILEQVVVDELGQPLTAGLHEYRIPTADVMPPIEVELMETPSPFTPGGMKGMGEGGTNGGFACFVSAVRDAAGEIAATRLVHTPLTPEKVVRALSGSGGGLRMSTEVEHHHDLVVAGARLVVTMDPERTEVPGGWVAIDGGVIAAVGPAGREPPAKRTVRVDGCLVTPGLVNTHHHIYQNLTRSLPPATTSDLFGWLTTLYPIWAQLDEEAAYLSAWIGLAELALGGCTTTSDHLYVHPRHAGDLIGAEITAAGELGMRFCATRGSMSRSRKDGGLPPDEVVQDDDTILADSERLVLRHHDPQPLAMIQVALAPCSPFSVTPGLMRATAELAERLDVRLHTHLAEDADEDAYCLDVYGCRPIEYFEDVGWGSDRAWVAHCVYPNAAEIAKLAGWGTGVAHCPSSNQLIGAGLAPIRELLDAGVPVGVGCDGSASTDSASLWMETRSALLLGRLRGGPTAMQAREALEMATLGGARCLGRSGAIGQLTPGAAADVVVWALEGVQHAGALADPVEALLRCGPNTARHTIVNGEFVVRDGRLVDPRVGEMLQRHESVARRWQGLA